MKIIIGLGNPGRSYEATRHNCGFRVLDKFAEIVNCEFNKTKFKSVVSEFNFENEKIILLKPQTFMNLSGEAVHEALSFYKVDLDDILVIFDDLSLNPGNIRLRPSGSSGGQKGMANIIDILKSDRIKRIRIGIGKPDYSIVDYVLGKPHGDEAILINEAESKAAYAILEYIKSDFNVAMNKYNGLNDE